jgi:hypothetical protein
MTRIYKRIEQLDVDGPILFSIVGSDKYALTWDGVVDPNEMEGGPFIIDLVLLANLPLAYILGNVALPVIRNRKNADLVVSLRSAMRLLEYLMLKQEINFGPYKIVRR